jgi:hypothetical protein
MSTTKGDEFKTGSAPHDPPKTAKKAIRVDQKEEAGYLRLANRAAKDSELAKSTQYKVTGSDVSLTLPNGKHVVLSLSNVELPYKIEHVKIITLEG